MHNGLPPNNFNSGCRDWSDQNYYLTIEEQYNKLDEKKATDCYINEKKNKNYTVRGSL